MGWASFKRKIPHWGRIVMNRDIEDFLATLPTAELRALEVSGWAHGGRGWKSYRAINYPDFDICTREAIEPEAEVVFCEQVLEHVPDPVRASKNLFSLLSPGGTAIVSVPFMVRIHNEPEDYWRFSRSGLRILLEHAGFEVLKVEDWGSRMSVVANLWRWCPYVPVLHSLRRSRAVPLVVWAFARKPAAGSPVTPYHKDDRSS